MTDEYDAGNPIPEPGADFEADVLQLLAVLRGFLKDPATLNAAELQAAVDNVSAWYEDNSPRGMGWVDDKGRP